MRGLHRNASCVLALAAAVVACATDQRERSTIATPTDATVARSSVDALSRLPNLDLASVIRRVHFAFRQEGLGGLAYRGAHSTYDVRVESAGFAFAPVLPSQTGPATVSSPLRLETAAIQRGDRSLLTSPRVLAHEADGSMAWRGDGIVERLRNDQPGAYQTWDVPVRPQGNGDFVVRIAARGQRLRESNATGLHFVDDVTGLGTRYGEVAWVDASGLKTPITPRFDAGFIELRVPASVIEHSSYPAVLDPLLGPEIATDTPVAAVSFEDQDIPVVARSTNGFLVAWRDSRAGSQDIYATRVSAAGAVLDPNGIVVSSAVGNNVAPAIASNGTDYFVVWTENGSGNDLFGRRIKGADGTRLDEVPIPVSTAQTDQTNAAIAFDGTHYVVAWRDGRSGVDRDIYYRRVKADDGALLDGTPGAGGIPVSTAAEHQDVPAIACDTTRCLIAWQDERNSSIDIFGARVEIATGAVLDAAGIAVSTAGNDQVAPQVASDGTNFAVVWQDARSGQDIYGARVASAAGTLLDATGVAISTAANNQSNPSIIRAGTQYLAVWQDARGSNQDVYAARLADTLVPVDATGVQLTSASDTQSRPRAAFDGTTALVVWQDRRTGLHNDVVGKRVTVSTMALADGDLPTGGIQLGATTANTQRRPQVASNGTNVLVVWQDNRSAAPDIYGVRIDPAAGTVLDPNGIAIGVAAGNQQAPHVTFGAGQYLVVWQDRRGANDDVYGQRVNPATGAVADGAGGFAIVTASGNQSRPRVAYSAAADNYLVAWHDSSDVRGRRVTPAAGLLDGAVTATGIGISTAANEQMNASVASNGTDYLVVWQDTRSDTRNACGGSNPPCGNTEVCVNNVCRNDHIYGARVTAASGAVQDASGVAISTANDQQIVPAVAFGGGKYFAVWQDRRTGSGGTQDIYGARIDPNGTVNDASGIVVSNAVLSQTNPAVAWNGSTFLAAWSDQRTGLFDLFGARVTAAGALVDAPSATGGFAISSAVVPEDFPAVTMTTSGVAFVAHQHLGAGGAIRVFGRTVAFAAAAADCGSLSDCASGFCVDGKCCDSACGGDVTTDCRACSVAAGAAADGVCATIAAARAIACRPSLSATCDPAEVCNGTDTTCPTDVVASDGTSCGAGGACTAGSCVEPLPELPDAAGFDVVPIPSGGGNVFPTSDGGTPGAGGAADGGEGATPGAPAADDDGCGCKTAGRAPVGTWGFVGALGALLAGAARRKRRPTDEARQGHLRSMHKESR